jgi:hypothetical protein
MIQSGPSWDEVKMKFSYTYKSPDGKPIGVHAGSFVAHRENSKAALRIWREEIEKGLVKGDNDAYSAAYLRHQQEIESRGTTTSPQINPSNRSTILDQMATTSTALVTSNPLAFSELKVPDKDPGDADNWYEKFFDPTKSDFDKPGHFCINHISKHRCSQYGRETVQRFVDQFGLQK